MNLQSDDDVQEQTSCNINKIQDEDETKPTYLEAI